MNADEEQLEVEVVEEQESLLPAPVEAPAAPIGLFGTDDPVVVVQRATAAANALMEVVEKKGLITRIGPSKHARVEAWTLLGSMLGVFPVVVWTHPIERDGHKGFEARAEARTRAGEVVGAAEAECFDNEANWRGKPSYSLRSMAQTRAISKALAGPLRFIMVLAGFEGTPAEEMDGVRRPPVANPTSAANATFRRDELLDELTGFFERTRGNPEHGWSPEEVIAQAQRIWGAPTRKIEVLSDLEGSELDAIKRRAQMEGVW